MNFSVILCVYKNDKAEYYKDALDSIINQTKRPNEIILVIDGPISSSLNKVIKNYYKNYSFIKIVKNKYNLGHGKARQIGLKNCSNELVALMDADDISLPDRFEKQIKEFEKNRDISIVGGNIKEFINYKTNIISKRKVPQRDFQIKKMLRERCPFNQVTVMFKKSAVIEAGGYKDWYHNEDYYLWLRMYQNEAIFKNIDDTLVLVRISNDMYKRRGGWKYFKSEFLLQKYMFNNKIINFFRFSFNVLIRFIIQVLLPSRIRGEILKKFARE